MTNAFYQQCRFVSNIIKTTQRTYYTEKLADNKTDFKQIFEISNKLLYKNEPLLLPPSDNKKNLADQFNEFFITKINKIMDGLVPTTSHLINNDYIEDNFETNKRLHEFRPLTLEETIKLVKSAAPKSCKLDPIPTIILLEHLDIIAPTLQEIINLLLLTGNMPQNMKEALFHPLLKKPNLDLQQFKNFRPVSNLSFVSKLIERAVCDQLLEYTAMTGKLDRMQSAYHADHSTEMALLKVKTDILNDMDNKKVNFLILLDLSTACDTVSFCLLMNRLLNRFGITGTVLKWIESYLTEQTQRVMIDEFSSDPVMLKCGVLQGSVLGPILYTLFTSPVGDISRSHNIGYHGFADDTQNYHSFTPSIAGDEDKCKWEIEVCISDMHTWMRTNLLKLNDKRTEFLIIGTKQQLSKVKTTSISVGKDEIPCSETARNLGYYYDQHMKNSAHINKLVSSLNVALRRILKIRNNIDYDTTKILVQAMVLSRLDYCNSLMLGSTKYNLKKLQ